jgi:DNA replication protein DnaC
MNPTDDLQARARQLQLHGLLLHWTDVANAAWLPMLIQWEAEARQQRSLERRIQAARLGRFKPLCEFDWRWPKRCARGAIETLMTLEFLQEQSNVILIGPNGVGKTMIAQNLAHQALLQGANVLFTTAGPLLGELAAIDSDSALRRRLKYYAKPDLLVIDEVGHLSYGNRHADLLFELVSRRYEHHSTLVTTNRPFAEWGEVFPNAACVVSLVDRLLHHAEIIGLEGESYRLREARERSQRQGRKRQTKAGGAG